MPTGCLECGDTAHLYDKFPGALAEDRAKIKYKWALVAERMQNGKTLKPKDKKLRNSLMMANKKWREEQEQSRTAKATEPEKKKLRRILESPAGESVATINGVLDVPYSPDNGSDVGIISIAMVETLRNWTKESEQRTPTAWLDVEDMRAAENLYKMATTSANAVDQAQATAFKKLRGIVVDAAAKGVWRTKFRGTAPPVNVKAMEIRLKADARPNR
ncbi:hypothetical protein DYB36_012744 [Aphanomyces astaci]|uniref:Uncharacterized protein n=1 Tax=Aphanomyces astaci TaxID=112090 RepID=A0A397BJH2_APHAT|nr:hypothetical protein DYB36_012744 [Aphanomyces astaci]